MPISQREAARREQRRPTAISPSGQGAQHRSAPRRGSRKSNEEQINRGIREGSPGVIKWIVWAGLIFSASVGLMFVADQMTGLMLFTGLFAVGLPEMMIGGTFHAHMNANLKGKSLQRAGWWRLVAFVFVCGNVVAHFSPEAGALRVIWVNYMWLSVPAMVLGAMHILLGNPAVKAKVSVDTAALKQAMTSMIVQSETKEARTKKKRLITKVQNEGLIKQLESVLNSSNSFASTVRRWNKARSAVRSMIQDSVVELDPVELTRKDAEEEPSEKK